jgi:hypothetical protein
MMIDLRSRPQNEYIILAVILLLALVNGLLYVFIMPPWQHYDEPNHFEYVWLLAERGERPNQGDFDTRMRQDVARSMVAHDFFEDLPFLPDLTSEKPWIGHFAQLNELPLYYLLASIPLRILPIEDVTSQLYAARLISMLLFLVTILAGYGLVAEITPAHHALRLLVPLTMALLPAFVDLMTAVNNDVGGIAFFSLFLWGAVRLIRRGPSWGTLFWVLATSALCLFTKRTVYVALPLLGVALLFGFLRAKYRKLAWGLVIALGIVVVMGAFAWGDAALWYRDTSQDFPTRITSLEAPTGESAFRLEVQPGETNVELVQIIPTEIAGQLSGKSMTLGAWIWASEPVEIQTPRLRIYNGKQLFGEAVRVTEEPQFFALHLTPQGNTQRTWVLLAPGRDFEVPGAVEIYYDGILLVDGIYPLDQIPQFDSDGASGVWGGVPFENLLRNASAESSWLYLRPWADKIGSQLFNDYQGQERFSLTIYSLIDMPSAGVYYKGVLLNLFRTFWAKFGWAHVPLLGHKPYAWVLLPLTLFACAGIGLVFWQHRRRLGKFPWDALFLLGLTILTIWGVTLLRGSTYLLTKWYYPVARYAYPAIIPTVFVLSTGWLTLLKTVVGWLSLPGWIKYAVYAGFFISFNAYALFSIAHFYG